MSQAKLVSFPKTNPGARWLHKEAGGKPRYSSGTCIKNIECSRYIQGEQEISQEDRPGECCIPVLRFKGNSERLPGVRVGGPVVKNLPASAGYTGSILGSGRSSGEGNGNPHMNSCLGNPMNRGAAKSRTWLSDWVGTQAVKMFYMLQGN